MLVMHSAVNVLNAILNEVVTLLDIMAKILFLSSSTTVLSRLRIGLERRIPLSI
jgi:hypothetical protein